MVLDRILADNNCVYHVAWNHYFMTLDRSAGHIILNLCDNLTAHSLYCHSYIQCINRCTLFLQSDVAVLICSSTTDQTDIQLWSLVNQHLLT